MTVEAGSDKRQIVPRWRAFEQTARLGELDYTGATPVSDYEVSEMDRLLTEWEERVRGISLASEVAGASLVLRQPHRGREAAAYVLNRSGRALRTELELAERVIGDDIGGNHEAIPEDVDTAAARSAIHLRKAVLAGDPRNAIAWVEIARGYTVLGQQEHAKSAMSFAVHLAPGNRHVLRSAARMYIHLGEPDRAERLVMHHARANRDPWLVAVEIAAADLAEEPPRLGRLARKLLDEGSWAPSHLTELAAAMGTVELGAGRDREARRYFRRSLERANENSLAQVEWASQQTTGLDVSHAIKERPEAFEARARASLNQGQWVDAAQNTWAWYYDQPFSSEATISGSYGTAVGGDFEQSTRFAVFGLRANPKNDVLLNNAAAALLQMDRPEEARLHLDRVDVAGLKDQHVVVNLATRGLLKYRTHQIDEGRVLYFAAVNSAGRYPAMQAMAAIHMALEEIRATGPQAFDLGQLAARLSGNIEEPAVKQWRERLVEQLTLLHSG